MKSSGGKDDTGSETKPGESTSFRSVVPASASMQSGGTGQLDAFLGKGCKVVGTLHFTGPVELNGHVEGEVNAQERLTIGEGAVINARVSGAEIVIRGTVNGDVNCTKRLVLCKPARIVGNITTTSISIEEGVVFEGKCSMSKAASAEAAKTTAATQKGSASAAA